MNRSRIILVDSSLRDNVGHHIEYDRALLKAASSRGIESVVLAHKELAEHIDDLPEALAVFSADMWGVHRVPRDRDVAVKSLLFLAPCVSVRALELVVRAASHPLERVRSLVQRLLIRRRSRLSDNPRVRQEPRRFSESATHGLVSQLLPPIFTPSRAIREFSRVRSIYGFVRQVVLLITPPAAIGLVIGVLQISGRALENFAPPPWVLSLFFRNPAFLFEIQKALAHLRPAAEDTIFCHMINRDNLVELAYLASKPSLTGGSRVVLLLRYPPAFYAPSSLSTRLAFRALERAYENGRLQLATDSGRLAKLFSELCYVPFDLYPIPHTRAARGDVDVTNVGAKGVIRIASLGNARAEKGILEIMVATTMLPSCIDDRKLEFVLQVNDPDNLCRNKIIEFRRGASRNVSFIKSALSSEEYRQLLESVDVVLLPYWHDVYNARTSGIFLEAIAAGKVIIATEDTWMADELSKYGAGLLTGDQDPRSLASAIVKVASDFKDLSRLAKERAEGCRAVHSADSLLARLLGEGDRSPPTSRSALVIFPWAELANRTAGAALRVGLLLDFLCEKQAAPVVICLQPRQPAPDAASAYYELGKESSDSSSNRILWLYKIWMRLCSRGRSHPTDFFFYGFRYWHRRRSAKLLLNKLVGQSSVVFLEYTFLADLIAPFCRAYNVPMVVTEHDVLAFQNSDPTYRAKLLEHEVTGLRKAQLPVCVSESDNEIFKKYGLDLTVVPNAIDIRAVLRPSSEEAKQALLDSGLPVEDFILFVGSAHGPNFEAKNYLLDLAKELSKEPHKLNVIVAGSCGSPDETGANFFSLGQVPLTLLRALYSQACAVVIPLRRGTGTSLKTIEAMAYGCVVIGTPMAFRGLPVRHGVDALIEADLRVYAALLRQTCGNDDRRKTIENNARAFAERYDYARVYGPYARYLSRVSNVEFSGMEC